MPRSDNSYSHQVSHFLIHFKPQYSSISNLSESLLCVNVFRLLDTLQGLFKTRNTSVGEWVLWRFALVGFQGKCAQAIATAEESLSLANNQGSTGKVRGVGPSRKIPDSIYRGGA